MAQADFDFIQSGGMVHVGGDDGTARLHSALASPLAGEGDYCRDYSLVSGFTGFTIGKIKATYNGGEFDQISESFSWSTRAWLRYIADATWSNAIGIGIKIGTIAGPYNGSGYWLMAGRTNTGAADNLFLVTASETGSGIVETQIGSGLFPANTWAKCRLDVVPVGTSQDNLEVLTGTGPTGSEIWTSRGTLNIPNTNGNYCDWQHANSGRVGFGYFRNSSTTPTCYIDRFQVFKEAV